MSGHELTRADVGAYRHGMNRTIGHVALDADRLTRSVKARPGSASGLLLRTLAPAVPETTGVCVIVDGAHVFVSARRRAAWREDLA